MSKQTNEVAGDGATTATVLADVIVQEGLRLLKAGPNPVELAEGLEAAVIETNAALKRAATSVDGAGACAPWPASGRTIPCWARWSPKPSSAPAIMASSPLSSATVETTLEVVEGMAFERGYLSHHMVTDVQRMPVVLDEPFVLITDHKVVAMEQLNGVLAMIEKRGRPLLIIAEPVAPRFIMALMAKREKSDFRYAAIHPPEYGHLRKAMLENIAIAAGGRVVSVDLGGKVERTGLFDLGGARQVRISSSQPRSPRRSAPTMDMASTRAAARRWICSRRASSIL